MDPVKTKPALIAGAAAGVFASASSLLPLVGCCCCLMPALCGLLATKLYSNEVGGRTVTPAEGATVGAMAGAVGAVLYLAIAIPVGLLRGVMFVTPDMPGRIPPQILSLLGGVVGNIFGAVFVVGLVTVGGLLGAVLFKGPGGPGSAPPVYPIVPPSGPGTPGGGPY
jgi:hypothetical protein